MDSSLRNSKHLLSKINDLQNNLLKRYGNLVALAAVQQPDRSATAVTHYQIQTETAGLIRAAEEMQTLIRHMQEMWLFGQLNTLEDRHEENQQAAENAAVVADLVAFLRHPPPEQAAEHARS